MEKQLSFYQEFKSLAMQKQEALIQNELNQLNLVTAQEEQILKNMIELENARHDCAHKIAQQTGKSPEEITLAELALRFPQLNTVYKDLKTIVEEIRKLHEVNAQLIDQALKIVNFTVNMLKPNETNTYQSPQQRKEESTSKLHLVDKKI